MDCYIVEWLSNNAGLLPVSIVSILFKLFSTIATIKTRIHIIASSPSDQQTRNYFCWMFLRRMENNKTRDKRICGDVEYMYNRGDRSFVIHFPWSGGQNARLYKWCFRLYFRMSRELRRASYPSFMKEKKKEWKLDDPASFCCAQIRMIKIHRGKHLSLENVKLNDVPLRLRGIDFNIDIQELNNLFLCEESGNFFFSQMYTKTQSLVFLRVCTLSLGIAHYVYMCEMH